MLDQLHDVIRRIGGPADLQELHDVAISREEAELFDFAVEQRPIDAAAVGVEFDRDLAARVAIDAGPDFAVRSRSYEPLRLIARDFGGRTRPGEAQVLRALLVGGSLLCLVMATYDPLLEIAAYYILDKGIPWRRLLFILFIVLAAVLIGYVSTFF